MADTQQKQLKEFPSQNNDDGIYIDATAYVSVVANDPFHPGQLLSLLIDASDVVSAQLMGYGVLDNVRTPVVRLIYENGQAEDVYDTGHTWAAQNTHLSPLSILFLCNFLGVKT